MEESESEEEMDAFVVPDGYLSDSEGLQQTDADIEERKRMRQGALEERDAKRRVKRSRRSGGGETEPKGALCPIVVLRNAMGVKEQQELQAMTIVILPSSRDGLAEESSGYLTPSFGLYRRPHLSDNIMNAASEKVRRKVKRKRESTGDSSWGGNKRARDDNGSATLTSKPVKPKPKPLEGDVREQIVALVDGKPGSIDALSRDILHTLQQSPTDSSPSLRRVSATIRHSMEKSGGIWRLKGCVAQPSTPTRNPAAPTSPATSPNLHALFRHDTKGRVYGASPTASATISARHTVSEESSPVSHPPKRRKIRPSLLSATSDPTAVFGVVQGRFDVTE